MKDKKKFYFGIVILTGLFLSGIIVWWFFPRKLDDVINTTDTKKIEIVLFGNKEKSVWIEDENEVKSVMKDLESFSFHRALEKMEEGYTFDVYFYDSKNQENAIHFRPGFYVNETAYQNPDGLHEMIQGLYNSHGGKQERGREYSLDEAKGAGQPDEKNGQSVTITEIKKNSGTKTICVEAVVSSGTKPKVSDYIIDSMQSYRTDIEPGKDGYFIKWYGFYEEESAVKNPVVAYRMEKLEKVDNQAEIEEIGMRSYRVSVGRHKIPVHLTSFSVLINPEKDWAEDDVVYDFFAQNKAGEVFYMCTLLADDMKSLRKKNVILNPDGIEELGEGYPAGAKLEHSGIEYVMNEEIDIHEIQKVYCKKRSKAETELDLAKDYLRRAEENLNEIDNIVSRQEVMESDDYAAYFIKPEANRMSEQVKKVWEYREKAEENLEAGKKILNEKKIDSAFYMTLEMYRDAVQGLYDVLSNYSEDELSGNPPVYVYGILNAKMDCWDTFSSVEKWQKDPSAPGFSNLK